MMTLWAERLLHYPYMCCSVVPLRCHVARRIPQLPHLCWTSLDIFKRYGMHPRPVKRQRPTAQTLQFDISTSWDYSTREYANIEKVREQVYITYCVEFPAWKLILVISRLPQEGQSTGAPFRPKAAIGVEVLNRCWETGRFCVKICCVGICDSVVVTISGCFWGSMVLSFGIYDWLVI
jgi:hypothetical protein